MLTRKRSVPLKEKIIKFLSVHRRERLVELGWKKVPFLRANGVTSWDQLKIVANSEGLENVFFGKWMR